MYYSLVLFFPVTIVIMYLDLYCLGSCFVFFIIINFFFFFSLFATFPCASHPLSPVVTFLPTSRLGWKPKRITTCHLSFCFPPPPAPPSSRCPPPPPRSVLHCLRLPGSPLRKFPPEQPWVLRGLYRMYLYACTHATCGPTTRPATVFSYPLTSFASLQR
ncbi:hypothetical protein F5X98DRAFT_198367 [Xylaria grammica]|nr:hypothetical protein F5X98DRAFT_198367 [Xylaria grammica]